MTLAEGGRYPQANVIPTQVGIHARLICSTSIGLRRRSAHQLPGPIRFFPKLNAALISDGKAFRVGADGICDQVAKLRKSFYEQRV